MKISLKELLNKLGVDRLLLAYEIERYAHTDSESGDTVNAEIRMGFDGEEVEIELLYIRANPKETEREVDPVFSMLATMRHKEKKFYIDSLRIHLEDCANAVSDWENKACNFFKACIMKIKQGEMPDIEELLEKEFFGGSGRSGLRGSGGRKSPKIRPEKIMGMKGGGSF